VSHIAKTIILKETGLKSMLEHSKKEELTEMYILFYWCPNSVNAMLEEIGPFILQKGISIINDESLLYVKSAQSTK